jgi:hypothetical protein
LRGQLTEREVNAKGVGLTQLCCEILARRPASATLFPHKPFRIIDAIGVGVNDVSIEGDLFN